LTIILNSLRIVLMLRLVVLAPLVLVAAACTAFDDDAGSGAGADVVAAFYPLEYAAERVAGEAVGVESLAQPGVEPHDLELTIQETALIANASVVVYEKGFQPAVDEAVDQNATGEVLDVTGAARLEDDDPHFWLDPLRLADVGDAIADALADTDPDHADTYAENAAALREDLERLDAAYESGLADCQRHTVVVSHDAFGYLERYGVRVAAIAGLSPEAEPAPADIGRLHDLIESDGITTVFSERLAPPELTETLAEDAGVRTEVLDPIEGLTDETADEDYLSLMERNLRVLEEANGCR